ncbi:MAG: Gfo/Idh/MocA family protein [Kofleriaceae bacterium]
MERVPVAIVGVGSWGINHLRVFARESSANIRWVCDSDALALARCGEFAPTARLTTDLDAVLDDQDIVGVIIATPAPTHAELACRALAAGKHILVEKPLALNLEDAERVRRASTTTGRSVVVGHLMIYHPALVQLRELLRSGELGTVRYLHSTRVNLGRHRRDENALWSFGPHDVSMLDYLLGLTPSSVAAQGGAYLQDGIEDIVFITLRFPNAVMGHIHLSWLNPRKERRLTIVGSAKMAELDDVSQEKLRVFDRGYDTPPAFTQYGEYLTIRQGGVHLPPVTMEEPLGVMARHFLDCCRGVAEPLTDAESGVRIVRVLTAAQESLRLKGASVFLSNP